MRAARPIILFLALYIVRQYILRYLKNMNGGEKGPKNERAGIEREFKRGALELAVLHLLRSGEAYGYDIIAQIAERTEGVLEVTNGTLYPVLYRLERAALVNVRWETQGRGVPRKYYLLTSSGREELMRLTGEWTAFAKAMGRLLR
jgi:PadR family transcriptional regulator PadR